MKRIAIVGGGASGIMAAITAARRGGKVTIFEKNARLGKKLISTGNGRCNITNINCCVENYHGRDPMFVKSAIEELNPDATLKMFESIGLMCKITHGGRVYPYCEQASAVLDVLRNELVRLGVKVRASTELIGVSQGFNLHIRTADQEQCIPCDSLIISTGGKAAPSTGSNGAAFEILTSLGHELVQPYPALTQLKTEILPLRGIRVNGCVKVKKEDAIIVSSNGEIQFTAYGISGPATMDISADALVSGSAVILDLLPHINERELVELLLNRQTLLGHLSCENFLVGMLNKQTGHVLLKRVGIGLSQRVDGLSDLSIKRLAHEIKALELVIRGHTGWEYAQVTGGGADTRMFNPGTMESKIIKNLFVTGEALDIYGDCGGYNLQWAWASGYVAGKNVCL